MITIVAMTEPVAKGRPRTAIIRGVARLYTPSKTAKFETELRAAALKAMRGLPPMTGALCMAVEAVFSVPKSWSKAKRLSALGGEIRHTGKPDLDNLIKTVDALNGIVWVDDSQIVELTAIKRYGAVAHMSISVSEK